MNSRHNKNAVLFLTLKVFSATGGIEKVCRVAGKALHDITGEGKMSLRVLSMYDQTEDAAGNHYFPQSIFKGYSKAKVKFIMGAVSAGRKSDTIILSHINLLLAGWLIKKIAPSKKIILFAHGIEIWGSLSKFKSIMLGACDEIWSVSHYTSNKIREVHEVPENKCKVLNNCLDPFLPPPSTGKKIETLQRFGFNASDRVMLTLTRLSATERYKNYDKLIEIASEIKNDFPDIRYLLAGKYDQSEYEYLQKLIDKLGVKDRVKLTGFIPDNELADYFGLADLYVMPSKKEGFGIVFIEAMYYGLPVIGGNKDGTTDALLNGKLGTLIDPDDKQAMANAIKKTLENKSAHIPDRQLLVNNFGFERYKKNIQHLLSA